MRESCWCGCNTHMTKHGGTDEEADPVSSPKSGVLRRVRGRGQAVTESVRAAPTWPILYMSANYEGSKSDLYSHAEC